MFTLRTFGTRNVWGSTFPLYATLRIYTKMYDGESIRKISARVCLFACVCTHTYAYVWWGIALQYEGRGSRHSSVCLSLSLSLSLSLDAQLAVVVTLNSLVKVWGSRD